MRGFLILSIIAVASSERLGYNYGPSGAGIGGGLASSGGNTVSFSSGAGYSNGAGLGGGFSSGSGLSSGNGFASGGVLSSGGGFSSGGGLSSGFSSGGAYSSGGGASHHVVTELNKEFYFHSAPEEEHHAGENAQSSTTTLKKNLRVVFIKAPENNGLSKAALNIAKQAVEHQTAIYVLTKEADASDVTQHLQQINEVRSQKPEVHFVKYRTSQDLQNAQQAIQAQYNSLGGSTITSDEGVAPVLNYASSRPVSSLQGSASHGSASISAGSGLSSLSSGASTAQSSSYLPPTVV